MRLTVAVARLRSLLLVFVTCTQVEVFTCDSGVAETRAIGVSAEKKYAHLNPNLRADDKNQLVHPMPTEQCSHARSTFLQLVAISFRSSSCSLARSVVQGGHAPVPARLFARGTRHPMHFFAETRTARPRQHKCGVLRSPRAVPETHRRTRRLGIDPSERSTIPAA